jgi:NAD(P)-dependent dehydrogenase (short-subunit alcohol dehydrogenase family)
MRLADKVALITGAGSGMGKAAALLFAKEGGAIAVVDIDEAAALEVAKQITAQGGKAFGIRADVSNPADAEKMVEETVKRFGKLNIIYNNAGIEGEANLTARFSLEGFERVIGINLRGVWLGMKYAIPHMLKAGGGSIINTSSTAGLSGVRGGCAYAAAKHGVIGLTKTAALEYGRRNIRVNAICPGPIATPLLERIAAYQKSREVTVQSMGANTPIGRPGDPEEIAKVALFLASDEASYANGGIFAIDGGQTAN